jgi:outer membrane lipoprotein-sorting protein
MKFWPLIIFIMLNFAASSSAQQLDILSDQQLNTYLSSIRQIKTLDANYIQNKRLEILNRQLKSEGRFIYVRDSGLLWHLKSPFELVTVIKRKEFYQLDDNFDRMADQANSDRIAPVLGQIFSIFSGDLEPLKKKFHLYGAKNEKEWTIRLVPIDEITKTILKDIVIKGNRFIETVIINNQNGDNTSIYFSEIKENSHSVTKNELLYFTK